MPSGSQVNIPKQAERALIRISSGSSVRSIGLDTAIRLTAIL